MAGARVCPKAYDCRNDYSYSWFGLSMGLGLGLILGPSG